MWLHYYYNIYLIKRTAKWKPPPHLPLLSAEPVRKTKRYHGNCTRKRKHRSSLRVLLKKKKNTHELNTWNWGTDAKCLPGVLLNYSNVLLLTIYAGGEFQIFMILLNNKIVGRDVKVGTSLLVLTVLCLSGLTAPH